MNSLCSLLSLVFVIDVCLTELTGKEKQKIVDTHNELRRTVSPPAAHMMLIEWDPVAEKVAQEWADNCAWEHNENRNQEYETHGGTGGLGENIAAGTYGVWTIDEFMKKWWNEHELMAAMNSEDWYDLGAGHYSQMAWHSSYKIGCGFHNANDGCADGYGTFLVCDYSHPGNYLGESPYEEGKPCSGCPTSHPYCNDTLCSSSADKSASSKKSQTAVIVIVVGTISGLSLIMLVSGILLRYKTYKKEQKSALAKKDFVTVRDSDTRMVEEHKTQAPWTGSSVGNHPKEPLLPISETELVVHVTRPS